MEPCCTSVLAMGYWVCFIGVCRQDGLDRPRNRQRNTWQSDHLLEYHRDDSQLPNDSLSAEPFWNKSSFHATPAVHDQPYLSDCTLTTAQHYRTGHRVRPAEHLLSNLSRHTAPDQKSVQIVWNIVSAAAALLWLNMHRDSIFAAKKPRPRRHHELLHTDQYLHSTAIERHSPNKRDLPAHIRWNPWHCIHRRPYKILADNRPS